MKNALVTLFGLGFVFLATSASADSSCKPGTASYYDPNLRCQGVQTMNLTGGNLCRFSGAIDGELCRRAANVTCPDGYALVADANRTQDRCQRRVNGSLQSIAPQCNDGRTYTQNVTYWQWRYGIGTRTTVSRSEVVTQREIPVYKSVSGIDQCHYLSDPTVTKYIDLR